MIEQIFRFTCDLLNCKDYTVTEYETDNEEAAERQAEWEGWVFHPESGSWACRDCVKKYGGKEKFIAKMDGEMDEE